MQRYRPHLCARCSLVSFVVVLLFAFAALHASVAQADGQPTQSEPTSRPATKHPKSPSAAQKKLQAEMAQSKNATAAKKGLRQDLNKAQSPSNITPPPKAYYEACGSIGPKSDCPGGRKCVQGICQ